MESETKAKTLGFKEWYWFMPFLWEIRERVVEKNENKLSDVLAVAGKTVLYVTLLIKLSSIITLLPTWISGVLVAPMYYIGLKLQQRETNSWLMNILGAIFTLVWSDVLQILVGYLVYLGS